jgi:hypothetical protein
MNDSMHETKLLAKAAAKINNAAQDLMANAFAPLRGIKSLKDWHAADYTLHTAKELRGITKEQYQQAVLIFADWWETTTGRTVIRAFTELQISELTGMSEDQRRELEEGNERLNELLRQREQLINRHQQGDRSDELFEQFLKLHWQIECSAIIDYTEETYRLFNEIVAEASKRTRRTAPV